MAGEPETLQRLLVNSKRDPADIARASDGVLVLQTVSRHYRGDDLPLPGVPRRRTIEAYAAVLYGEANPRTVHRVADACLRSMNLEIDSLESEFERRVKAIPRIDLLDAHPTLVRAIEEHIRETVDLAAQVSRRRR